MTLSIALLATLPWLIAPIAIVVRARRSRSLDEVSDIAPSPAPFVSVVIPARNEAHNIEQCVRSVLKSTYPTLEVIVVDDHSVDGTADAAIRAAQGDARFRLVTNPDLPDGWFGKQWACANGARLARGSILLFADADTTQAHDLIVRSVNAMRERGAALLSVAGRQELGSFWERVVQPQIFAGGVARYGNTELVSNARRPTDAIANGQCLFVTREGYDTVGGHESVRGKVAEDLALAQRFVQLGERIALVLGLDQLSTRMYTSLGELIDGWRKNIYAGGVDGMPFGAAGRAVYPLILIATPLVALCPVMVLLGGVFGVISWPAVLWAGLCVVCTLVFWVAVYRLLNEPLWYALLYPLGLLVLLYIAVTAVARGRRVAWKGREYRTL